VIQSSNRQVRELYADSEMSGPERDEQAAAIIRATTDFAHLSHSVLDKFCQDLAEPQCAELDRTFRRLLLLSSIRKLGRYRADRFEYLGEEVEGETAWVRTIAHYGKDAVTLDYRLARHGVRWRIVNYVVDGVDTIRNYKKQFNRLFAENSYDAVLDRLKRKVKTLEEEPATNGGQKS